MPTTAARVHGLSKQFGATLALDAVDFDVVEGEIHALVGQNGAGKSTLVRILGGVHQPDRGTLEIGGTQHRLASPRAAIAAGIATIPQELRLVPALSVAENLTLGAPPVRRAGPAAMIDRARMREEARSLLAELDFAPDPDARVDTLSFAERQLVAFAKALRQRCKLLILDEPTAALEAHESERLFAVLSRMKAAGAAIIYVSHRLDEVVRLADRCTVLRDGRIAARWHRGEFSVADVVEAMTGEAQHGATVSSRVPGSVLLADAAGRADAVAVHAREVVGLAGLIGSGAERILQRLFGIAGERASIQINGDASRLVGPASAIRAGIGMVPGERRLGLIMNLSVADNILLSSLDRVTRGWRIDRAAAASLVAELMELLDIRPRDPALRVSALSGGNQQKVILAKWLARRVHVLLLDEPTQGVDVAAKAQIHALLARFADDGGGVLMSSSDLDEVAGLCDRVLALRHGSIAATLERRDGLDDKRLTAAIGG